MRRSQRTRRATSRLNADGARGAAGFAVAASVTLVALLAGCAGPAGHPAPPPAPAVVQPALESAPPVELAPAPASPATATPGAAPSATRDAKAAAAPYSRGYGARVAQAVRANIIYPATALPRVKKACEVEVSTAPDGRIVGFGVTESSGSRDWDDAVKRALMRTHLLPLDADGRVPASLVLRFSPR